MINDNAPGRKPPIEEEILHQYDVSNKSPLWASAPHAFEAMFASRPFPLAHVTAGEAVRLRPSDSKDAWRWYVTKRYSRGQRRPEHAAEQELYDRLFGKSARRRVYLYGHTGCGKTTLIVYFFKYYLPHVMQWKGGQLDKLVPMLIPFAFADVPHLEASWDERVYRFLYQEFRELQDRQFLLNVGRHIAFPSGGPTGTLVMSSSGDLRPNGHERGFAKATEDRVVSTWTGADGRSVLEWIRDSCWAFPPTTIGKSFNRPVIQVLSRHYGYHFIFIADNVDELPAEVQAMVFQLLHEKMLSYGPYPNTQFLMATRANFVEPAMSETAQATEEMQNHALKLDPVGFGDVLRAHKAAFFDPAIASRTATIQLTPSISATPAFLDQFMERVFAAFDNVDRLMELYRIGNHNIRRMLDVVRVAFESPHIDAGLLADIVSSATRAGVGTPAAAEAIGGFLNENRLVDVLVRGQNSLVATTEKEMLPNLWCSSSGEHFSSTLCRPFLLAIVVVEKCIVYLEVQELLSALGHPPAVIKAAANGLLISQVVMSNVGLAVQDDPQKLRRQTLETRDLPYGHYLLCQLGVSLRYVQAMGYVSPLQQEFLQGVCVPDASDIVSDFSSRISSASALYRQVRQDMEDQKDYVRTRERPVQERLERVMARYALDSLVTRMRVVLRADWDGIARARPELTRKLDFDAFFPAP